MNINPFLLTLVRKAWRSNSIIINDSHKENIENEILCVPRESSIRDLDLFFMTYSSYSNKKKLRFSRYSVHNWDKKSKRTYRRKIAIIIFFTALLFAAFWISYYNQVKLIETPQDPPALVPLLLPPAPQEIPQEVPQKKQVKKKKVTIKKPKPAIPVPTTIPSPKPLIIKPTDQAPTTQMLQAYVVKKGDTLESIATEILKDPNRVQDILKYNKIKKDKTLRARQVLKLPIN